MGWDNPVSPVSVPVRPGMVLLLISKGDSHCGGFPGLACEGDLSTMGFDDGFADGEPEPGS